jgi:hypothetical protein
MNDTIDLFHNSGLDSAIRQPVACDIWGYHSEVNELKSSGTIRGVTWYTDAEISRRVLFDSEVEALHSPKCRFLLSRQCVPSQNSMLSFYFVSSLPFWYIPFNGTPAGGKSSNGFKSDEQGGQAIGLVLLTFDS